MLTKKTCLENIIGKRDEKWHLELQTVLSVNFWDKTRHLNSTINFDNPGKWLQYQINRNSLQTNYIVSHFIRNVSPLCHYCGLENEKISHLYWFCRYVGMFLNETFHYICSTGTDYEPSKLESLFGVPSESFEHPKNLLSLLIKKYIWKTKFKNAILNIAGFKNYLKTNLNELKIIYDIKEEAVKFNEWILLYSDLCQVVQHAPDVVQAQPPQVPPLLLQAAVPLPALGVPPAQLSQGVQDLAEGRV